MTPGGKTMGTHSPRITRIRKRLRFLKQWKHRLRIHAMSLRCRARGQECVHVLHIGKTGGTALREALASVSQTPKMRVVQHLHRVGLRDIPRRDRVVVFVRDPMARFVSGFYSRQRRGRPRYNSLWTPGEAKAFARFGTPNELALALSSSEAEERLAALEAMRAIKHVRAHYSNWLASPAVLDSRGRRLFVGRTEALNQDFEVLKVWLGIPSTAARLPTDRVRAHKMPHGLDTRLDTMAIENLRVYYAEDIGLMEMAMKIRADLLGEFS